MAAKARRKTAVTVAAVVAGLVVVALVVLLVKGMLQEGDNPRKTTIQQIAVLKPPPPPPPPKPEVKPPEIKKEEVKIEQPKEQPPDQAKDDQGPPPDDKGPLDPEAQGKDELPGDGGQNRPPGGKGGKGTGGERAQFGWYTGRLQRHLQDELAKREDLKKSDYRVVVRIWLARDGRVERAEVAGSSGNADTDQAIREALGRVASLAEAPPDNMPQPIRLRITSRGAG